MGLSCKFSPKPIHRLPEVAGLVATDGRAARSGLAWKVMKLVFDVFALTLIHVISDDGSKKVGKPW